MAKAAYRAPLEELHLTHERARFHPHMAGLLQRPEFPARELRQLLHEISATTSSSSSHGLGVDWEKVSVSSS